MSLLGSFSEFDRHGVNVAIEGEWRFVVAYRDVFVGNGTELHNAGRVDGERLGLATGDFGAIDGEGSCAVFQDTGFEAVFLAGRECVLADENRTFWNERVPVEGAGDVHYGEGGFAVLDVEGVAAVLAAVLEDDTV